MFFGHELFRSVLCSCANVNFFKIRGSCKSREEHVPIVRDGLVCPQIHTDPHRLICENKCRFVD